MLVTELMLIKPIVGRGKACYGTSKSSALRPILPYEPAEGAKGSSRKQPKGGKSEGQGQGAAGRWSASQPGWGREA